MALESIHHAKNIYDATRIRAIDPDEIVNTYAAYTTSRFNDARHSGTVRPLVIPARNEASDLPAALLSASHNHDIFPLVIDNLSTDDTAKIARKMGAGVLTVDYGKKMAATQEGLRSARHDLGARAIYFSDADTLFPKDWANAMHRKLTRTDHGNGSAVFGNSLLWHGESRSTDILLSAAKLARAAHRAIFPGEVVARGHNYAVLLDEDGRMEDAMNLIDPHTFSGDDLYIRNALIDSGAHVVGVGDLGTTVVTRNDRVRSITQRLSRSYNKKRDAEYDTHYEA
jgi:glycosyltransferase involved in cell wall biosynthesis